MIDNEPRRLVPLNMLCDMQNRVDALIPERSNDNRRAPLVVTEKAVSDGAISTMDADGSNKQRVFTAAGGAAFQPAWSPDGKRIVYRACGGQTSRLRATGESSD